MVVLVHISGSWVAGSGEDGNDHWVDSSVDFSTAMVHERVFVVFVLGAALIACALVGHSRLGLRLPGSENPQSRAASAQQLRAPSAIQRKAPAFNGLALHWLWKPLFVANGLHIWRAVCGVWLSAGVYCAVLGGITLVSSSLAHVNSACQPLLLALIGASPASVLMLSICPVLLSIALPAAADKGQSGDNTAASESTPPAGGNACRGNCRSRVGILQTGALALFAMWRVLAYFVGRESVELNIHLSYVPVFSDETDAILRILTLLLAAAEIVWVGSAVVVFPGNSATGSPVAQVLRGHNQALIVAVAAVDIVAVLCFPSSVVSAVAAVQAVHSISFGVVLPVLFLAAARVEATRLDIAKATAAITRFSKEVRSFSAHQRARISQHLCAVSSIHRQRCKNSSCTQETVASSHNRGQFLVERVSCHVSYESQCISCQPSRVWGVRRAKSAGWPCWCLHAHSTQR